MRYVVRRIGLWSALRVGASIGLVVSGVVIVLLLFVYAVLVPSGVVSYSTNAFGAAIVGAFIYSGILAVSLFILALAYNIASSFGGSLEIELAPSDGSQTFSLTALSKQKQREAVDKPNTPDDASQDTSHGETP